jgi:ABC-type branched-subunit amino acid transport system ATPase component
MGIAMAVQKPLPFGSMTVLENVLLGAMFGAGHSVVGE